MAFSPVLFGRRLLLSASFLNLNLNLESSNDNSCITFFQQVGFASLESGSVRAKNTRNVLLKVKRERERERVGDSEKKREREAVRRCPSVYLICLVCVTCVLELGISGGEGRA